MTLADDVNIEEYIMSKDDLSGADIKAICTEAGLMALRLVVWYELRNLSRHGIRHPSFEINHSYLLLLYRERRMRVTDEDFKKSKENVLYRKNEGTPEGLYL